MARPALNVRLTQNDKTYLSKLLRGEVQQVRMVLRALILLQLDKGASAEHISAIIPFTPQAIRGIAHRYEDGGLDSALSE